MASTLAVGPTRQLRVRSEIGQNLCVTWSVGPSCCVHGDIQFEKKKSPSKDKALGSFWGGCVWHNCRWLVGGMETNPSTPCNGGKSMYNTHDQATYPFYFDAAIALAYKVLGGDICRSVQKLDDKNREELRRRRSRATPAPSPPTLPRAP